MIQDAHRAVTDSVQYVCIAAAGATSIVEAKVSRILHLHHTAQQNSDQRDNIENDSVKSPGLSEEHESR